MLAADFQLVRDINTSPTGRGPRSDFVAAGSTLYFTHFTNTHGLELWKSDGTTAGTVMVRDLFVGHEDSSPMWMTDVSGTLFFTAHDGENRSKLWKTDGTWQGTVLVREFYSGSSLGHPLDLTNVNGTLYFTASDGVTGRELWKSDGTTAGTVLVKDIWPGESGSSSTNLTNINGRLFFEEGSQIHHRLFVSDGTASGTQEVKGGFYYMAGFREVGNKLYFGANDGVHGEEIWVSDGTTAGTYLLKDLGPGGQPGGHSVVDLNGTAYFGFHDQNGNAALYRSDGTEAGTVLVRDGFMSVIVVGTIGGSVVFSARNSSFKDEIWTSDGTYGGTKKIASLEVRESVESNGVLYFTAHETNTGIELWKTDGTIAGTVLVTDLNPGPSDSYPRLLTNVNGVLFFNGVSRPHGGLWKSDGTASGTVLVKDSIFGTNDADARYVTNVNGTAYFTTDSEYLPSQLWVTEESISGTLDARELRPPGATISRFSRLKNHNGTLYFLANDNLTGQELWKTDGTDAGTVIVKDIAAGKTSSYLRYLESVRGLMYFSARDTSHGHELWCSDGTEAGTVMLADINPGYSSSTPSGFTEVDGVVYFTATSPAGTELWRTDGTSTGTRLVKDIIPGPTGSMPQYFENVNGVLYFQAQTAGNELWKSDGTAAGTVLVYDRFTFFAGNGPRQLTNVNGTLFFTARDPDRVRERLWKSDGTAAGTTPIDTAAYWFESLTAVGDTLYFSANTDATGNELWRSDGTSGGTSIVRDLTPGILGSEVFSLTAHDNRLFFRANDGVHGLELWESDGTEAGTILVDDITHDSGSSYPTEYVFAGTTLFAAASTEAYGAELYATTINMHPVQVTLTASELTENQPSDSVVGSLTTIDPNAGDTHVYSLVSGAGDADNAKFRIAGASLLTVEPLNYELQSVYSVRMRSTDQDGLWTEQTLSVLILDENETPLLNLNPVLQSLPENFETATRTLVAQIQVIDDALGANAITLAGVDAASYEIDGTGLYLKANVPLDFETQAAYSVVVQVDDSTLGATPDSSQLYVLQLRDVNEAPSNIRLLNTVITLPENTSTSSPIHVADLVIDDDSLGTNVITLSGSDAGVFEISGEQLRLKTGTVLNYESQQSFSVRVAVDDVTVNGSPDVTVDFVLTILDENEAPTLSLLNLVALLPENTNAGGIVIADIQLTDDALGTNVLTLAGADAEKFRIVGSRLVIAANIIPDYESQSEFHVTLLLNDDDLPGTPEASAMLTVQIRDINEVPLIRLSSPVASLNENTAVPVARRIADIEIIDDALGTNVLTLSGADANLFQIAGSQLRLKANVQLDYEKFSSLQVTVQVDDETLPGDPDDVAQYVLRVLDVNEAPSIQLTAVVPLIPENAADDVAIRVADLNLIDDALGTVQYVLSGADAALFSLSGGKLWIRSGASLDFEKRSLLQITVGVYDPSLSVPPGFTAQAMIRLTDVNEKPAIRLENTVTIISENTSTTNGIRMADIKVEDDALGHNVLSLAGRDAAKFVIQNGQLVLRAGTVLNYEKQARYDLTLLVDDTEIPGPIDASCTFSFMVRDVNERPWKVRFLNTVTSLPENTAISRSLPLGDLVIMDDAMGNHVLSLMGDDAGYFRLVNNRLYLAAGTSLDFERKRILRASIAIDDTTLSGFPDYMTRFALRVIDINEAPQVSLTQIVTVLPDSASTKLAIAVARIRVTDDALGQNTLTLAGPDAAKFVISGSRLMLRSGTVLNGRTKPCLSVQVIVRDISLGQASSPGRLVNFRLIIVSMTPQVTQPAANSVSLRPVIMWTEIEGVSGYQIRMYRAENLNAAILQANVSTNSYRPSVTPGIGAYVVEVRSIDSLGRFSYWSDRYRFHISTPVQMLSPVTNGLPLPRIRWMALPGAVAYDVLLEGTSPEQTRIYLGRVYGVTSLESAITLNRGHYRVKVRGVSASGHVAEWSIPVEIVVNDPMISVLLISPLS